MPYILDTDREQVALHLDPLLEETIPLYPKAPGVLNYIITKIVSRWLGDDYGYDRLNSAIGVLEAVKLELYRRVVVPYEEDKRAENGDVFPRLRTPAPFAPFANPVLVPAQVPEQKRYPYPWGTVNRCQAPGCARIKDHPGTCVDTTQVKP